MARRSGYDNQVEVVTFELFFQNSNARWERESLTRVASMKASEAEAMKEV